MTAGPRRRSSSTTPAAPGLVEPKANKNGKGRTYRVWVDRSYGGGPGLGITAGTGRRRVGSSWARLM
jgi:hypothetical protein